MGVESAQASGVLRIQTTPVVNSLIAGLGRTEDLRFSPSGRQVAIAGYLRNQITVLSIDIRTAVDGGKLIVIDRGVVISSPALNRVHGLDFLDEDTIIAANRRGGVPVFRIPGLVSDVPTCEVQPIRELAADGVAGLDGPGSVVVSRHTGSCDVLICNNFSNTVTRHRLDTNAGYCPISSQVLLRKWFDIPDGISLSRDQEWIAVSQAACGWVGVYPNSSSLNPESDPSAILRQVFYPHGLKFSRCGRFLLVADAGAPNVQVFQRPELGWYGVLHPVATWEVMDKSLFERGHVFVDEGGCKGLDLHPESAILALTCEFQTLRFIDVSATLANLLRATPAGVRDYVSFVSDHAPASPVTARFDRDRADRDRAAAEVAYELHLLSNARAAVQAGIDNISSTRSWRITAPLRKLNRLLNGIKTAR